MTFPTLRPLFALGPALAAAMTLAAGPVALAQPLVTTLALGPDDDGLTVKVRVGDLATAYGRVELRRQLETAADAYCRGHPSQGATVYDCRRDLTRQLVERVETRTGVALGSEGDTRLARQ